MSSPSERFECHWQGSRLLLVAYLACLALALGVLGLAALPGWLRLALCLACLTHAAWAIPRRILLDHPQAVTGLRRDPAGWWLYSRAGGWQAARLCRDSVALPGLVVLRFVRQGDRFARAQCIPGDALAPELHRRLRLRLKFSRRRWAAPG
ncbi:protein YgfX [Pseudomonas fulva]|nr:protein YgfX [Pseudomonas fulva]MBF8781432.1 hypothetical protein [Pseudomonas fulva]